jgi:hypothetical protein
VTFSLPAGQLLGIRQVRALCGREVPAGRCPRRSRLGIARVWTPLLAGSLEGPVYLRAPDQGRLPDLLADLRQGQIQMLLHGHTATSGGRLRVSFANLPDVPVSKAVVALAGGRHGLLVNSSSLCTGPRHTVAVLKAHNGKRLRLRPKVGLNGRC